MQDRISRLLDGLKDRPPRVVRQRLSAGDDSDQLADLLEIYLAIDRARDALQLIRPTRERARGYPPLIEEAVRVLEREMALSDELGDAVAAQKAIETLPSKEDLEQDRLEAGPGGALLPRGRGVPERGRRRKPGDFRSGRG